MSSLSVGVVGVVGANETLKAFSTLYRMRPTLDFPEKVEKIISRPAVVHLWYHVKQKGAGKIMSKRLVTFHNNFLAKSFPVVLLI